jgi:hypothetical protein
MIILLKRFIILNNTIYILFIEIKEFYMKKFVATSFSKQKMIKLIEKE